MIHGTVIGNLGKDAEMKNVNGKSVLKFSVATKGRGRDSDTTWVGCAMWGQRGEKVAEYLTKGTKVAVVGTLTVRMYEGKAYVDCDVQELELLGGGQRKEEDHGSNREIPF